MEYRAFVQYDWTAVDPAELTVTEGQTVVVKDVNDRGWALVFQEDSGLSGWVPNDYLRPLDDDEVVEELPPVVVEEQVPDFTQEQVQNAMNTLALASQAQQQQQQQQQQPQQPNPDAQPCGACGQPIESSALIAKGKHFHQDCFCCSVCRKVLSGGFLERDGQFFCEEDYYKSEGFVCTHCNQAIVGARIMGNGKPYHTNCLLCSVCNCSIGNDVLHVKDDKNICHNCYNTHFAAICTTCNQPIEFQIFSALDKSYHKECFVCHEGNHPMPDESFHAHEGNIYCPEHYKKLFSKSCHQCKEEITGQYLDVVNRFFHPKCWKCTMCDALLENTGCSIKNDQFYCPTCVVKVPSNTAPSPTSAGQAPRAPVATAPKPAAAAPIPAPAPKPASPVAAAPKPTAAAQTPAPAPAASTSLPQNKTTVGLLQTLHQGGDDISTEEMRRRLLEISEKAIAEANKEHGVELYPVKDNYTHAELMNSERLPQSVDRAKKETYLTDADFQTIFGMDKTKFAALKGWKQNELKKGAKIF